MQTFLPYPNLKRSAECLDPKRLGKQRIEVKQILNTLTGKSEGWKNHPAVKMWTGHEGSLALYGMHCCNAWIKRGYKDNQLGIFTDIAWDYGTCLEPWWFGDKTLHRSHQSNLLRKDPEYYRELFVGVPSDLPYYWPEPIEEDV